MGGGLGVPQRSSALSGIFTLGATDGAARAGVLRTAHGEVPTPAFMPVGTKATVKSLHPDEVRELGAHVILGNTYHLHFRPGEGVIAELGGLHRFMGWDGPILTDSGGFQVFSLRDTMLAVDDDGVTFRSVYDGAAERLTPESAAAIQAALGSDIAMCLDICPPADAPHDELEQAVRRTTLWAERQLAAPRAPGQLLFGIAQGGVDPELRRRSIEEIAALGFDGYALGGLTVGESREEMLDTVAWAAPLLPEQARATSWGSATRRGSSRWSSAGSTCSTAFCRRGSRAPAPRSPGGPAQPPERPLRARPAPARGGLRLSRLHALLARLHPPPRQPAGDARAAAPQRA